MWLLQTCVWEIWVRTRAVHDPLQILCERSVYLLLAINRQLSSWWMQGACVVTSPWAAVLLTLCVLQFIIRHWTACLLLPQPVDFDWQCQISVIILILQNPCYFFAAHQSSKVEEKPKSLYSILHDSIDFLQWATLALVSFVSKYWRTVSMNYQLSNIADLQWLILHATSISEYSVNGAFYCTFI